jgi:hypothetical protein
MNSTKLENVNGKGPTKKAKSGRFEVSIWHWKKVISRRPDVRDYFPEREIDVYRACVRHTTWNRATREWQESRIWCNVQDLRSLAQAVDELNKTA